MKRTLLILLATFLVLLAGCTKTASTEGSSSGMTLAWTDADLDSNCDLASSTLVTLNGAGSTVNGKGVTLNGSTLTITAQGTYILEGSADNLNILVNADKALVRIILKNARITATKDPVLQVDDADKVVIILSDGTSNTLTGGSTFTNADLDAAVWSKADLTINGTGTLAVTSPFGDGISSKDDLKLVSGQITVNAAKDGIKGRDRLAVKDATLAVTSGADGLEATNDQSADLGFLWIEGGRIQVQAGGDALAARTSILLKGGSLDLATGSGAGVSLQNQALPSGPSRTAVSTNATSSTISQKGLKAGADILITGGTITTNTTDDALHAAGLISIAGAALTLASGDDGIHSDTAIHIESGTIAIRKSYEGIESAVITIDGGTLTIASSDDGINIAGGVDGSAQNGRPGQSTISADSPYLLTISGGSITVDALGDGVDIGGNIVMNGGSLLVYGPTSDGDGSLDYDGTFLLNGGTVLAGGSMGMAMTPGSGSRIPSVSIGFQTAVAAGTPITVRDASGNVLTSFTSPKAVRSLVASTEKLAEGGSYTVYVGDVQYATFTQSGTVTTAGAAGNTRAIPGGSR